ncbi:unnamed protein product [Closterium sp. NIES-65]|nr:unnamed protein product [Closterium sp. NIES-65]
MASRYLVSGLPRSLPPLPPGSAPTCVPCIEGRQRAAPHSSEFPPTEAPLQTRHLDVWGPARVHGHGHERYFLLVVDDDSRYTMVFPLCSKGEVTEVLIGWIRATRLQLRESFGSDFLILRLHSDRGGEFSSDLLRAFWRAQGIRQTFTLPASPQQNGIVEHRIGMVMDVARTSMIHAATPHFLWPFAVQYAAHQINLQPGVDAVEPVEVAVDSGAPRGAEPASAGSGGAEPGCAESRGAEPGGAESGGAESGGAEPGGAETWGAEPEGAGPARVESGGTESGGPLGASSRRELLSPHELREWFARRWSRAAGAGGAARVGGSTGAQGAGATGPGGARTGGTGAAGPGGDPCAGGADGAGAGGASREGAPGGAGAGAAGGVGGGGATGAGASEGAGVGGAAARGATGVGGAAGGAGAVPADSRGATRPRPYFVPLLEQVLRLPPSAGPAPSLECPPPVQSESQLLPASTLPAPSPYTGPTRGLADRQSSLPALADPEIDSLRAANPTVTRLLATAVTDPSFESTAASALKAELVDFAAHCCLDYAASLVAESDGNQQAEMALWKSTGTYVDEVPPPGANIISGMWIFRVKQPLGSPPVFKARYVARGFSQRQGVDYFQTFSPTLKMTTLRVLLHIAAQRDYELHSLDFSTAFLQGSLHEEIWLRRPPGFTGSFPPGTQWSLRQPVYGLRKAPREWHDTLRTTLAALGFAPSTADPSLFLRTDTSLPPFYILVYAEDLVFATADTAGLAHVKSELQKRHTCTDRGELRSYLSLQITRDRAQRTITLTQSHMVQQVLQRFDFTYSSPQATPLSTRHSLSALPSDESVEPSGPYPELETLVAAKRVLRYLCSTLGMGLVLGGRRSVVLTGHADASWADDQATQRSSQGYTFNLGSGSVSWRSTRSSSVLGSSCEAEFYAGAMAGQELRWLTYLLTDLGEPPRSPPVLYVDNKAMLALC